MNNVFNLSEETELTSSDGAADRTPVHLDEADRMLLRILQADATLPLGRLADRVGLSKTAVWNRIQRLQSAGVILRQVMIVDPERIGLPETFFVALRTSNHNAKWFAGFIEVVAELPEITEAHRMAGQIDYLLRVQVESTRKFDEFYQKLVAKIDLIDVTSHLSMEVLKRESALPV